MEDKKNKLSNLPKTRIGVWQMSLSTTKPVPFRKCCHHKGHRRLQPRSEITGDCKLRADVGLEQAFLGQSSNKAEQIQAKAPAPRIAGPGHLAKGSSRVGIQAVLCFPGCARSRRDNLVLTIGLLLTKPCPREHGVPRRAGTFF